MESEFRSFWRLGAIVALTLFAIAAIPAQPGVRAQAGKSAAAGSQTAVPPGACTNLQLSVGPNVTIPGDVPVFDQIGADCFAWAEFIPLNWRQGHKFGHPKDLSPVLWEKFITQEELFPPNGGPPSAAHAPPLPAACQSAENVKALAAGNLRVLRATSKFGPPGSSSFNFPEAAPTNAWLGAQNGTNVWYEVLINRREESFVIEHQFYNAAKQQAWVASGHPFILPEGTIGKPPSTGQVGALELKAAWMEAPDYDTNPDHWDHYLVAPAVVVGPSNTECRSIKVALVGLHIIQKTKRQPFWVWATFEHVDNVPGDPHNTSACCNFYSKQCQPRQVAVSQSSCLPPKTTSPVTVSCTPNTPPPYYLGVGCPGPVPIQVTRVVPLPETARSINETARSLIQANNPTSVFQYYQLVDVLWFENPTPTPPKTPTQPQTIPIQTTNMIHGNGVGSPQNTMTNTTIETYVQTAKNTAGKPLICTDCHSFAAIGPQSARSSCASDFSFAVGTATAATGATTKTCGKKN